MPSPLHILLNPRPDSYGTPSRSRVGRTRRDRNDNPSPGPVFTVLPMTLPSNLDDNALTSPSMISLNSVSPPLTHTATRTEFAHPRTGPTSEQVKSLSSGEAFGRFSLPYGPDAIVFAARSPPDFDSIHRPNVSDLAPNPDDGFASSLRRSARGRRGCTGDDLDRGESPLR